MATTLDGVIAAARQYLALTKTASRTSVAVIPFSVFDLAGGPGAGVLAGTSTTSGVVPTDATVGCPDILAFGGAIGNLELATCANTVASTCYLYDLLFKAGAYAFNASQALSSQPSFLARVPADDIQTELWIECVTAFTGNLSIAVTYTNQAGVTGRTTGTVATGIAPTVGRMVRLPLQAGDTGVRAVESVVATVATVGTFNVLVMRRLIRARIPVANGAVTLDWTQTGRRRMFTDMALVQVVQADSTSTGLPDWELCITNS